MGMILVEKANKRELILTAAREIFGEKGYHSATSEEIAKRAGVGKGTIYQYFESKQDIFLQMHILYLQQYSENVTALIHEDSTFEENLRRLIRFHLDNLHDLSQFGTQFISKVDPATISSEEGCAIMKNFKEKLGIEQYKLITVAQQRGEIKEVDAELVISCMMGMFIGLAHSIGRRQLTDAEKKQMEERLISCVLHGLAT